MLKYLAVEDTSSGDPALAEYAGSCDSGRFLGHSPYTLRGNPRTHQYPKQPRNPTPSLPLSFAWPLFDESRRKMDRSNARGKKKMAKAAEGTPLLATFFSVRVWNVEALVYPLDPL